MSSQPHTKPIKVFLCLNLCSSSLLARAHPHCHGYRALGDWVLPSPFQPNIIPLAHSTAYAAPAQPLSFPEWAGSALSPHSFAPWGSSLPLPGLRSLPARGLLPPLPWEGLLDVSGGGRGSSSVVIPSGLAALALRSSQICAFLPRSPRGGTPWEQAHSQRGFISLPFAQSPSIPDC